MKSPPVAGMHQLGPCLGLPCQAGRQHVRPAGLGNCSSQHDLAFTCATYEASWAVSQTRPASIDVECMGAGFRVTGAWLLSYSKPNWPQQLASYFWELGSHSGGWDDRV